MSGPGGTSRRVVGILLAVVAAIGAVSTGVTWLAPYDRGARVAAQVRHLSGVDADAAVAMQQAFPEGELFTYLLAGLAAGEQARSATDDATRRAYLDIVQRRLDAVLADHVRDRFGTIPDLPGGIFYRGWTLLLESYLATVDDGSGRRDRYRSLANRDAQAIVSAVADSPHGFVASYPGQYWPCDTVVALAAVVRLRGDASGLFAWDPAIWAARVAPLRDPATGLLPHQVDAEGNLVSGSRGSSQSIIQAFWPDLTDSRDDWARFVDLFVTREAGLLGVREHPRGSTGAGDVDSGPLVLGVSVSASAVGLAAARANGDLALAEALDREAEMLGVPWEWNGSRSYAFGLLPVGDAFLAWARSVPQGSSVASTAPRPLWPLWLIPWLLLGAVASIVLRRGSTARPGSRP